MEHSSNNLFRRLANSQYQSYTTALTITIAVGCFLLLLNVLIFAGIYYQREKRATDAKRKEELTESENRSSSSPSIDKCSKSSRKSSLQSVTGFTTGGSFGEYSCYDEKIQCKEKRALADICSVELPLQDYKCSSASGSVTSSIRCSVTPTINYKSNMHRSHDNLVLIPPTYSTNLPHSSGQNNSNGNCYEVSINHPEHCNQSTQSEQKSTIQSHHDVGTTIAEHDVDLDDDDDDDDDNFISPGIPEPPPPPRSMVPYQQPGILRQQGGSTTPGTAKKRVQIQEISV